jgi:hypothetical protein
MKVIAIFMTILLLLSGFDFCKDDEVIDADGKEKTALVKIDREHQDEEEVCSPFCQCARCPFSILLPQKLLVNLPDQALKIKFLLPIAGDPTGLSASVWQPPKAA